MRARTRDSALVRRDFDEIARLAPDTGSGVDRYDAFLVGLVPPHSREVLEIGCGLGRLARTIANGQRHVTAVDLSPEMIARARAHAETTERVRFVCADFLEHDFAAAQFDCIVSAAMLHHVPEEKALARMVTLLKPGGRLIVHDLRSDGGLLERVCSLAALLHSAAMRLLRTGRARSPRPIREAWKRHGAAESYLTFAQAEALAQRLLPGARVRYHWHWRYTIVWDRPVATCDVP